MRPSFTPRLINDPFSDPGLFVPFLFEKRALMFDLGDLHALSPKDLLKVTHVFVTHSHMDHFIGFDILLRPFLGREKKLHLYGPPGFLDNVEGRLAGYTWNLVHEFEGDFRLKVTEVHPSKTLTREYSCRNRFSSGEAIQESPFTGTLLRESAFHVETVVLDHRTPCLGLALVEHFYINIIKEGLKDMDLPMGPWLTRFKKALHEKWDMESRFTVTWEQGGEIVKEKGFVLGELVKKIAVISPGQRVAYVTDIIGSPENFEKVDHLARGADHLYIEAAFLDEDRETAHHKYHLTAKEAGEMARRAEVKAFTPFHFSPRYRNREAEIGEEAQEAFRGEG
ncbi:MAG: ribonuclease Z [Deltaproteobacteria bacterium]|nr:ribonuclease Z [Deltaproteobacteria bacterium]